MAALYQQNGVTPAPDPLTLQGGTWAYYLYDGPELALVLQRSGTTVKIQQRFVSAGVDGAVAGRFWVTGASAQSLALLTDHQGTTLAAVNPNGTQAAGYVYKPLSAFGASDNPTASPSGSVAASSTAFTGASTPNATGGMVYLRNRWYDPATGRFLTQDPIGLAGGVNLYAYAGNNPISFSDPYGLCDEKDPWCRLAEGVARPTHLLVRMELPMLAVANLPTFGLGEGAPVALGLGSAAEGGEAASASASAAQAGVQANRAQGLAGERAVKTMLQRAGANVVGSQVSMRTSQGIRVIDHLIEADGSYVAVEVKTGNAVRNAAQLAKDAEMGTQGATVVGKNAPAALRGLRIESLPTVEIRPF